MSKEKRSRHGLNRLMVAIKTRDLRALDRRCAGSKALMEWKADLLRDLGGESNLSVQKRTLADAAVRSKLFIDSIDVWLLQQRSLVNARKKSILPALAQRQTLLDGLLRIFEKLGLERLAEGVSEERRIAVVYAKESEADGE